MKVLVFGNINSGKSYLIDRLHCKLNNYKIIQLDEYRKKYSNGTLQGEQLAVRNFVNDAKTYYNAIIEATGLGDVAKQLKAVLSPKSYVILKVNAGVSDCLERMDNEKFDNIPYPYKTESVYQTIKRIDIEIQNGELEKLWEQAALAILQVDSNCDLNIIPFDKYQSLITVLQSLVAMPDVEEVVLYGSLGRKEYANFGDADVMVLTHTDKTVICDRVCQMNGVTFIDILPDKLTVYFDKFLIEIAVVKDYKENKLYLENSLIQDFDYCVVKGKHDTVSKLQHLCQNFVVDKDQMIIDTVKRLTYFVLSLDRIKQDNMYKFMFHSNIIVHEIVRLKKQLIGEVEFNYLPKNSDGILKELHEHRLVFTYNDNFQEFTNRVRNYVCQLYEDIDIIENKYKEIFKV